MLALRVEPDVPLVPVALSAPRWRHPVMVTERMDELPDARVFCEPDGVGFWAIAAAVKPRVRAAHVPDQIRVLILPPATIAIDAWCNCRTSRSPSAGTPNVPGIRRGKRATTDGLYEFTALRPRQRSGISTLPNDVQFEIALLPEDSDADVERLLLEEEIGLPERQFEIEQPDVGQERRQDRMIDRQPGVWHVD